MKQDEEQEWQDLHVFLSAARLRPSDIQKKERPDFILYMGDGTIGVEHTRAYLDGRASGSPLRARESILDRIRLGIAERIAPKCEMPVHVNIVFGTHWRPRKADVPRVVGEIADFLDSWIPPSEGHFQISTESMDDRGAPPYVTFIHGFATDALAATSVGAAGGGFVLCPAQAAVQAVLDSKEHVALRPNHTTDQKWLLVVYAGDTRSSMVDMRKFDLSHKFYSSFDAAYVMDMFGAVAYELKV